MHRVVVTCWALLAVFLPSCSSARMWEAARRGDLAAVEHQLRVGVPPDRMHDGQTALMAAAKWGHPEVVRRLLAAGANPNAEDRGWTAIEFAACSGDIESVRTLLEAGAKVDDNESSQIGTIVHMASEHEATELVLLLLEQGLSPDVTRSRDGATPLHVAASEGNAEVVRVLVERGAGADRRDDSGRTPLHEAASGGHTEAIHALLECGVDIDARDVFWKTPLHLAAQAGEAEATRALLFGSKRACADAADAHGLTPLHEAVLAGSLECAKTIAAIADLDRRSETGRTALHFAARRGSTELFRLLEALGAATEVVDEIGDVPEDYLRRRNRPVCSARRGELAVEELGRVEIAEPRSSDAPPVFVRRFLDGNRLDPIHGIACALWEDGAIVFDLPGEGRSPRLRVGSVSPERVRFFLAEVREAGFFEREPRAYWSPCGSRWTMSTGGGRLVWDEYPFTFASAEERTFVAQWNMVLAALEDLLPDESAPFEEFLDPGFRAIERGDFLGL